MNKARGYKEYKEHSEAFRSEQQQNEVIHAYWSWTREQCTQLAAKV